MSHRINDKGLLELSHPETGGFVPAIAPLQNSGGLEVKLNAVQDAIIQGIESSLVDLKGLSDPTEQIVRLSEILDALRSDDTTIANLIAISRDIASNHLSETISTNSILSEFLSVFVQGNNSRIEEIISSLQDIQDSIVASTAGGVAEPTQMFTEPEIVGAGTTEVRNATGYTMVSYHLSVADLAVGGQFTIRPEISPTGISRWASLSPEERRITENGDYYVTMGYQTPLRYVRFSAYNAESAGSVRLNVTTMMGGRM